MADLRPGTDGMTVKELRPYLKEHWLEIREALESGRYQPTPVRRVEIPKPNGGMRQLGIPTVLDRLLQQAIAQGIGPLFEAKFSEHSYGFRPGRSAHLGPPRPRGRRQDRAGPKASRLYLEQADGQLGANETVDLRSPI